MKINQAGLALIKEFEGFFAKPYLDPVGIPTIGYGTIVYPDGRRVKMGDPSITEARASEYLAHDVAKTEARLAPLIKVPVTANEWSAIVSLFYNVGVQPQSTLLRKLNAGDKVGAANEFLRWNKARVNGELQVLRGLTRRREAERKLFLTPDGE